MKIKPAAPILGVAAVVMLAIALYAALGSNVGAPRTTPSSTPAPSIAASRLASIALIPNGMPDGIGFDDSRTGEAALQLGFVPGGPEPDTAGFVDAQQGDFSGSAGLVATWVALFETAGDAERLYDELVSEHDSDSGWGFARLADAPRLGDESAGFDGAAGGADAGTTYIWRSGTLVLAVIGVDDFDRDLLREIAGIVADRAG